MATLSPEDLQKLTPQQLDAVAQCELLESRHRAELIRNLRATPGWIERTGVIQTICIFTIIAALSLMKAAPLLPSLNLYFVVLITAIIQGTLMRTNRRIDALVEILEKQVHAFENPAKAAQENSATRTRIE